MTNKKDHLGWAYISERSKPAGKYNMWGWVVMSKNTADKWGLDWFKKMPTDINCNFCRFAIKTYPQKRGSYDKH
jgi:hypothetical protein